MSLRNCCGLTFSCPSKPASPGDCSIDCKASSGLPVWSELSVLTVVWIKAANCWGRLCVTALPVVPLGEFVFAPGARPVLDAPTPTTVTGRDGVVPEVASDDKNWDRPYAGPETPMVAMNQSPSQNMGHRARRVCQFGVFPIPIRSRHAMFVPNIPAVTIISVIRALPDREFFHICRNKRPNQNRYPIRTPSFHENRSFPVCQGCGRFRRHGTPHSVRDYEQHYDIVVAPVGSLACSPSR